MSKGLPDWRVELATKVSELIRAKRILVRFRKMCDIYRKEKKSDENRLAVWETKRKRYCFHGLRTLDDFKARHAETERIKHDPLAIEKTRPASDTTKRLFYDYYHGRLDNNDATRIRNPSCAGMLVGFCAWVPPELALRNSPELKVPSIFGRFTEDLHESTFGRFVEPDFASLAEKYTTLAAMRDSFFPDQVPIDQKRTPSPQSFYKFVRHGQSSLSLHEEVASLPDWAEVNVREWLADINSDLIRLRLLKKPRDPVQHRSRSRVPVEASAKVGKSVFLRRVIATVHEEARKPKTKERYCNKTRAWALRMARQGRWKGVRFKKYLREENPNWSQKRIKEELATVRRQLGGLPVKFREDPVEITLHSSTPLDKKIATLTAIHDSSHDCGFPLSPWKNRPWRNPFRKDATKKDAENYAAWLIYRDLCNDVAKLRPRDLAAIESFVSDVCRPKPRVKKRPRRVVTKSAHLGTDAGSPSRTRDLLKVDNAARTIHFKRQRLDINAHADFEVASVLYAATGGIVPYVDLLRAVKPKAITEHVGNISNEPPEAKEARKHINRAFKAIACPLRIETVRKRGYRLYSSPD